MKKNLTFTLIYLLAFACTTDELPDPLDNQLISRLEVLSPDGDISYFTQPDSDDLSQIPSGFANPITQEKVELGKMLFYETGLAADAVKESGQGTYSCASCHIPSAGFMPGRLQGIADGGVGFGINGESRSMMNDYDEDEIDVQGARALSLLNVAFVTNTSWSGRFGANHANKGTEHLWNEENGNEVNHIGLDGLEAQNIEGTQLHRMRITRGWLDTLGYLPMYDAAFGDFRESERYTHLTTSFAISAYLRTLLSNQAPFQQWLRGDELAMTRQQKRGALVFFSKAGCYNCHKGAGLSSVEFHAIGVHDLYETGGFNTGPDDNRNFGRGGFTGEAEDMFKFKVPQIYNMKQSPFYFHGSSHHSLASVVEYFNTGIPENDRVPKENISPYFHPLNLTEQEKADLVKFLEDGLYDPNLQRYVPDATLSGNCFPNNDPLSRAHLGCD
jgi:cytochrome c peroxidase